MMIYSGVGKWFIVLVLFIVVISVLWWVIMLVNEIMLVVVRLDRISMGGWVGE